MSVVHSAMAAIPFIMYRFIQSEFTGASASPAFGRSLAIWINGADPGFQPREPPTWLCFRAQPGYHWPILSISNTSILYGVGGLESHWIGLAKHINGLARVHTLNKRHRRALNCLPGPVRRQIYLPSPSFPANRMPGGDSLDLELLRQWDPSSLYAFPGAEIRSLEAIYDALHLPDSKTLQVWERT
ncbi:hypothetical protein GQ53DRAFT_425474 [Thozetella sp. PMI_491]|nr:hypothetical protein GQ53DRAFT_425474 [Thozetella sp. PMI_491]